MRNHFFSIFKNVSYINKLDENLIFEDTFSIINSVNFVISVDTAINHIAGYLGKKKFLLLKHPSSFYWGYSNSKSTDYENHILIRQKKDRRLGKCIKRFIRAYLINRIQFLEIYFIF